MDNGSVEFSSECSDENDNRVGKSVALANRDVNDGQNLYREGDSRSDTIRGEGKMRN